MLFIDGFSHLREMDHEADDEDETSKLLKLLHSETDDEAEEEKDGAGIEEEKQEPPKEVGPSAWNCPICTFENPISAPVCTICEQGNRPSMQEL